VLTRPSVEQELDDLLRARAVVVDPLRLTTGRRVADRVDLGPEPASPARSASTPRSPSDTVACGFFFAPMIPFNDG
jgi:hypothetical protein